MRLKVYFLIFLGGMLFSPSVHAEILGDYLGYTACRDCHPTIVEGWKTTPHASAFESLKEQGEEKQSIPGCVKCHVVAFEQDGGFIDMDLTPELKDVQCENCHGPGRAHVESGGDPGLLTEQPDEAKCRSCHTEGQDKNFDYASKSRFVHGDEQFLAVAESVDPVETQKLTLSATDIEYGTMKEGDVVENTVILTNEGNAPLTIANVTTS